VDDVTPQNETAAAPATPTFSQFSDIEMQDVDQAFPVLSGGSPSKANFTVHPASFLHKRSGPDAAALSKKLEAIKSDAALKMAAKPNHEGDAFWASGEGSRIPRKDKAPTPAQNTAAGNADNNEEHAHNALATTLASLSTSAFAEVTNDAGVHRFTPGNFEIPHLPHPHKIIARVDRTQLDHWARHPDASGIIIPFGTAACHPDNSSTTTAGAKKAIEDFLSTTDVQVAPPNASTEAINNRVNPISFLVLGLTPDETRKMIAKGGLADSETGLAFLFLPLHLPRPTLAVMLQGFTTPRPEVVEKLVKDRLVDHDTLSLFNNLCKASEQSDHIPLTMDTIVSHRQQGHRYPVQRHG
jgi:hypothetical protein